MEKVYDSKEYFTRDVLKEIKLYTLDKRNEDAKVIGSLSYRSSNASDCDLFEIIKRNNKNDLIKLFKSGIQRMVRDLTVTKKQYFLEVKLGLDPLFKSIGYGRCSNDNYNVDSEFFNTMRMLYSKKLISDVEMGNINLVEKTSPKRQLEFEIIKSIMRKHTVLRWDKLEIIKGYKVLRTLNKSYNYTIEEAVCDKSQINIEGIFVNGDNIYSDCSNFFVLEYGDAEKHLLNLSDDALNNSYEYMKENLSVSTYTLAYSVLQLNLFKALKRMLSFGRIYKNIDLINKVYPVINSQLGQLYQMTSQLKTIMKILKEHGNKYILKDPIYHQLDKIRFRLQELIFVEYDFNDIYELINVAVSKKEHIKESELYVKLDEITHNLMTFLNKQTYIKMRDIGLYPLPPYLVPQNKPF